mgnify:CR=1 FL=1
MSKQANITSDEELIGVLEAKRQVLMDRLEAINQDYRRGLDADSEERAQQLENAEVLEGIAEVTMTELEKINQELLRLRSGS